jgi:hypothetical protein
MRRLVHVLIVLSISIPSLAQSARRLTRSELHSRRQQWFRQQRATPQGYFPSGLRWKALQQLDQMMQAEESLQRAGTAIIPAAMSTDRTKKSPTAVTREPQELENQISLRAYELYEARGREDGHEQEDWLRAEEEITSNKVRTATV